MSYAALLMETGDAVKLDDDMRWLSEDPDLERLANVLVPPKYPADVSPQLFLLKSLQDKIGGEILFRADPPQKYVGVAPPDAPQADFSEWTDEDERKHPRGDHGRWSSKSAAAPHDAPQERRDDHGRWASGGSMTANEVAGILSAQFHNRGRTPESMLEKWVNSDKFVPVEIPIHAVTPFTKVTPGDKSYSSGPIIVDKNKTGFARLHGAYGAPASIVILDGKHRWQQAVDAGEKTIKAFVGTKALQEIQDAIDASTKAEQAIEKLSAQFLDPHNESPGSALTKLRILLEKDPKRLDALREQRKKLRSEAGFAFSESEHPRGQPKNKGQFVKKKAARSAEETPRARRTTREVAKDFRKSKPEGTAKFIDAVEKFWERVASKDTSNPELDKLVANTESGSISAYDRTAAKIKEAVMKDVAAGMDVSDEECTSFVDNTYGNQDWGDLTAKERVAASLIRQWASTSNDNDSLAKAVQLKTEELFAIKDAYPVGEAKESHQKMATRRILENHGKVIEAFVKSCYNNTQKALSDAGITEMVLYRGMYLTKSALRNNAMAPNVMVASAMKLQPLSSFSVDFGVAVTFAEGCMEYSDVGDRVIIMSVKVPRERIFSSAISGSGCLREAEVVVLGGDVDSLVFPTISLIPKNEEEFYKAKKHQGSPPEDEANFAFEESEHPRGQPENKGQFVEKKAARNTGGSPRAKRDFKEVAEDFRKSKPEGTEKFIGAVEKFWERISSENTSNPELDKLVTKKSGGISARDHTAAKFKIAVIKDVAAGIDVSDEECQEFIYDLYGSYESGGAEKERIASELIAKWASTSNDNNALAKAIQYKAEELFAVEGAYPVGEMRGTASHTGKSPKELLEKHGKVIEAFVKSCYNNTQKVLSDAGIDEMVLYRGMSVKNPDFDGKPVGVTATIKLQPLSSFSTDFIVARRFAEGCSEVMGEGENVCLMSIKVPRERIFSSAISGSGCLNEAEVIVLGGDVDSFAFMAPDYVINNLFSERNFYEGKAL